MYMEPTLYPSPPSSHARTCMRNYARGGEIMYVPDPENRYQCGGAKWPVELSYSGCQRRPRGRRVL